ncbi:hypothetical protein PSTT_02401 [Puccinia striiformis]|uniref:Uncharacterized protein n=2 Tax=Puccinia striiformis TaxID=27350 RepID=A0A0L0VH98_9BASI|nr:hypothetical protein PSTG_08032 [Puccinia striiformis f. sp. tritici PST-78]POW15167.1 hypothetical protein PSTT_02401 [Puccinia striiformis]
MARHSFHELEQAVMCVALFSDQRFTSTIRIPLYCFPPWRSSEWRQFDALSLSFAILMVASMMMASGSTLHLQHEDLVTLDVPTNRCDWTPQHDSVLNACFTSLTEPLDESSAGFLCSLRGSTPTACHGLHPGHSDQTSRRQSVRQDELSVKLIRNDLGAAPH